MGHASFWLISEFRKSVGGYNFLNVRWSVETINGKVSLLFSRLYRLPHHAPLREKVQGLVNMRTGAAILGNGDWTFWSHQLPGDE
jgi:hypothetical protein